MRFIRNIPYPVTQPEEHKRFRGIITTRAIAPQKVGERLWTSDGHGYTAHTEGSLRRYSDPLMDFLFAEMGRDMNKNDFAGRLTGKQARQYRRYKQLKEQFPKKSQYELLNAAKSHVIYESYLHAEAKQEPVSA